MADKITVDDIIIANDERRMRRKRIVFIFLVFAIIILSLATFYTIYIIVAYAMPSLVHLNLSLAEVESSLDFLLTSIFAIYVAISVLITPEHTKYFTGVLLLGLGIFYFNSILSIFKPLLFLLIVFGSLLMLDSIKDLSGSGI